MSSESDSGYTAICPFCDSENTELRQRKGTAICRVVFYCHECNQPFEEMR